MTNKLFFVNYSCGELCAVKDFWLEFPRSFETAQITLDLRDQGWLLKRFNKRPVFSTCECGKPIFSQVDKYCIPCWQRQENERKQLRLF